MTDHADLESRLRAFGAQPVDPTTAETHLASLAAVGAPAFRHRWRLTRARVAAAFAAGLVLGSTGLASAGVLGSVPQNVMADTAAKVGVNLPGGKPRSTEGCDGKQYKNHGQFVKAGGDPKAKCGKPAHAGTDQEKDKKADDRGKGKGCGPPPWAKGNHAAKTPEAVAAFEARCGKDDVDAEKPPKTSDEDKEPKTVKSETTSTTPPTPTTGKPAGGLPDDKGPDEQQNKKTESVDVATSTTTG